MVLISDTKYACETCIKGHRSSSCKHTDRPLFEIKKKGRPVTQCEHCRQLRKTKQVHVKCLCVSKDDLAAPPALVPTGPRKKVGSKIPAQAAFPNGLPSGLEVSIHNPPASEGSSESGHEAGGSCMCGKSGSECHCCVPRKSAPRNRPKKPVKTASADDAIAGPSNTERNGSISTPDAAHILARISELRPVLPRPAHRDRDSLSRGSVHDLSSGSTYRHPTHDSVYYSPYSRAYGYHAPAPQGYDRNESMTNHQLPPIPPLNASYQPPSWPTPAAGPHHHHHQQQQQNYPPLCTCGPNCGCPGCTTHNPGTDMNSSHAYSSCMNPETCTMCLDCTIMSMPSNLLPPAAPPAPDPATLQTNSIDDWIRQISMPAQPMSLSIPTVPSDYALSQAQFLPPPTWDQFQLPLISEPAPEPEVYIRAPSTPPPSPVGLLGSARSPGCRCAPGQCTCGQGSDCESWSGPERPGLTFAVSGERESCSEPERAGSSSGGYLSSGSSSGPSSLGGFRTGHRRGMSSGSGPFLTVPEMGHARSRSSSTSSQSSAGRSHSHSRGSSISSVLSQATRMLMPTPMAALNPPLSPSPSGRPIVPTLSLPRDLSPSPSSLDIPRSPSDAGSSGDYHGGYSPHRDGHSSPFNDVKSSSRGLSPDPRGISPNPTRRQQEWNNRAFDAAVAAIPRPSSSSQGQQPPPPPQFTFVDFAPTTTGGGGGEGETYARSNSESEPSSSRVFTTTDFEFPRDPDDRIRRVGSG